MDVWVYGCLSCFLDMRFVQLAEAQLILQSPDVLGQYNHVLY